MHWLLLTVLSVVCVNAVAEVTCPSKCRCNQYKSITCTGITNEELLRIKFPLEYVKLKLENNQLSEFPPKENFVNNSFTTIILSGNKFSAIPDFPDTVTVVQLNNNRLSGELMSSNFTTWIKNAYTIDLFGNKITGIHAHAFAAATRLINLDLSHNQIKHLHQNAFANLTAVGSLELYGNLISTLAPGLFDGMKKLKTLTLRENQLTSIHSDFFTNVPLLHVLYLNKNRISKIAPGSFGNELQNIYLSDNLLTAISTNWYVNLGVQEGWGWLQMERNELNCSCLMFNTISVLNGNRKLVRADCYDKQNIKENYKNVLYCYNNATCSDDGESFTCACTKDFKGKSCITAKTPCDYNPCHHNATCTDLSIETHYDFSCSCASGYKGKTCD